MRPANGSAPGSEHGGADSTDAATTVQSNVTVVHRCSERDYVIDRLRGALAEMMAVTLMSMPADGWPCARAVAEVSAYWHGVVVDALGDALERVEREP
jgi:hypothetical protein